MPVLVGLGWYDTLIIPHAGMQEQITSAPTTQPHPMFSCSHAPNIPSCSGSGKGNNSLGGGGRSVLPAERKFAPTEAR